MNSRPSTAAPILAALAIVAVPLVLYVAGYFWLGVRADRGHLLTNSLARIDRTYPQLWLAKIYKPAGQIEERLGGVEVEIRYPRRIQRASP